MWFSSPKENIAFVGNYKKDFSGACFYVYLKD